MSFPESIHALVLAAGKGTRMRSNLPKVLHTLLGEPMLWYIHQTLEKLFGDRVHTVIGCGADKVQAAFPECQGRFVLQAEQLGTGHALQVAWESIMSLGLRHVVIVNGDTPLLPANRVQQLVDAALTENAALAFLSITPSDPGAYGRVLRGDDGAVTAIVEAKDYDVAAHGPDRGEVNAGIYFLDMQLMAPLLPLLKNENKSGEFYITDLVNLAVSQGLFVTAVECGEQPELMGINSPFELVCAEERLAAAIAAEWLQKGVLVRNPGLARIGPRVALEPGAEISGPCELYGRTVVHCGARVDSNCVVRDSELDSGAHLRHFSHAEGARLGPGSIAGPYVRLRPGAVLEECAHAGNFVELKKAVLGKGAKANHLTYLGDVEVGEGTNIGAGTITCNYDGKLKHKTVIGRNVFIGSNTALVAPITVGDESLVGAGSTLTKNVEPGELAIARQRQKNLKRRK
ncbi:bifunctional UDP-N-acetylglucosamine diphosphorylase/glucosamine-1-phosphate N-acetyltransferase GlmU [Desulfocurvibacter africanus]|uniref:bifunctional UDP-N-acetylglucosamine diphosphorylase/glucosamine-1-phosphate N-acetyltransferase GlmU n=1 Tax=Desulfocurvibacter africanus TaxID=873 RepID=UPI002FD87CF3